MKRAVLAVAAFSALSALSGLAVPAGAVAAPRWYVATDRGASGADVGAGAGAATVSGYAVDGAATVPDDLTLSVERGGSVVVTASGVGFAQVVAPLAAGDALVLTDTTTAVTRTTTFTGLPTLAAPACGAAAFTGTRADAETVTVTAPNLASVSVTGAGTALSGAFSAPLAAGTVVKASTRQAVDATFTVFDAVSATVGACPVVESPTAPAPIASPAPVVSPAPTLAPAPTAPAPPADTLAPAGKTTLRTLSSAALYRALRAGTFASSVSTSEPATIHQTLLAGKATLATTSLTTTHAGTFSLKLKLSTTARRRLTTAKTSHLTLKTTLRDTAGNTRSLPSRTLVARR